MRTKKQALLSLVLAILATLSVSALAACGSSASSSDLPDNPSIVEDEISISLQESATVAEFETITLTPTVVGEGNVVWSSSDKAVATVEGGAVTGVKAGTAVITATLGDKSASCTVTVTETPYEHELALSLNNIVMFTGEVSDEITVSVKFNNDTLDVPVQYAWAESDGASAVATIAKNESGSAVTFTAVAPGTATFTVSATVRGYAVSKQLTVTVQENVYTAKIANVTEAGGEKSLKLVLGSDDTKTFTIGDVTVIKNGVEDTTPVSGIVWASSNMTVATVEGGVITALAEGTSDITAGITYGDVTVDVVIKVTVEKGAQTLENTVTVETISNKIAIPAAITSAISKITLGSAVVAEGDVTVSDGYVTVESGKMPVKMSDLGEGKVMLIETADIIYSVPVNVYTMIIDSKEDLDSWQEVACDVAVSAGLCSTKADGSVREGEKMSGYYVMNADIDYNGAYTPFITFGKLYWLYSDAEGHKDWGSSVNFGFTGVFDGKGHAINGMSISDKYNGFVTTLSGGTIKNVAFVNASVANGANLVAAAGSGTIENVFVKYKKVSNTTSDLTGTLYCNYTENTRVTKNVVIDITDCTFDKEIKNTYIIGLNYGTFENVVLIGDFAQSATDNAFIMVNGDRVVDTDNHLDVATYGDLLAEANATVVEGLLEGNFFVSNDKIVLPKVELEKHKNDTPVLPDGTATSIELESQLTLSGNDYTVYSLVSDVTGVALDGNVLSVGANAQAGDEIKVKATSLASGNEAEFTFTVAAKSYVIGTQIDAADMSLSALVDFGLSSIDIKSVILATEMPNDITGASGSVVKLTNYDGNNMSAHGASITLENALNVGNGFNYLKLRMYLATASDSVTLWLYRSDRAKFNFETNVYFDANPSIKTNKWVDVYLDASKFIVDGKISGFKLAYVGAAMSDLTIYIDYISGETNAYTLGEDMVADKLTIATSAITGMYGCLTSTTLDASAIGIDGASGKVLKLIDATHENRDIQMDYVGVKFNNLIHVEDGYKYIKVRMYIDYEETDSNKISKVTFNVFRTDRPAYAVDSKSYTNSYGDVITTAAYQHDSWNVATKQWVDLYLDVSRYAYNGGAILDGFAFAAVYNGGTFATLYIDSVSIVSEKN